MNQSLTLSAPSRTWVILFWVAQLLLAGLFGLAGVMKISMAPDALAAAGINYATDLPYWLLRFIGMCELLGAVGIVLPALTRILPWLTPLAALGFVTIQVLAIGFHTIRGELAMALPLNMVLLSLALLVLWGRSRKAPVQPRG